MIIIVLLLLLFGFAWLGFELTCNIAATCWFLLVIFTFGGAIIVAISNLWKAVTEEGNRVQNVIEAIGSAFCAWLIWIFQVQFFF